MTTPRTKVNLQPWITRACWVNLNKIWKNYWRTKSTFLSLQRHTTIIIGSRFSNKKIKDILKTTIDKVWLISINHKAKSTKSKSRLIRTLIGSLLMKLHRGRFRQIIKISMEVIILNKKLRYTFKVIKVINPLILLGHMVKSNRWVLYLSLLIILILGKMLRPYWWLKKMMIGSSTSTSVM